MSGPDNSSKDSKKPSYRPLTGRMTAMGSNGWEAYTVGFTLVGCIVAGAGLGYFLDNHFKTSFWLPVLFLLGVIGGFREMFVTIKRVEAEQKRKRAEKEANRVSYTPKPIQESEVVEPKVERERIFKVPPPPIYGETPKSESETDSKQDEESVEELIQRLLKNETDEPDESDPKSEPHGSDKKS